MIGTLFGTVEQTYNDYIVINVNNIGYIVYLSAKSLSNCKIGDNIKVYIHNHVTKDTLIRLYGFLNKSEENCMNMLIKVNGISCKTAMMILSHLTPEEIISSINNSDKLAFKIPGLGVKLISRIITELQPEVGKMEILNIPIVDKDSLSALVNLGYDKKKSYETIKNIKINFPDISTEEAIYKALRMLK